MRQSRLNSEISIYRCECPCRFAQLLSQDTYNLLLTIICAKNDAVGEVPVLELAIVASRIDRVG